MITPPPGVRIWLAAGVTDMRCGFDGLAAMVQQKLALDPFSGQLFVFRGRRGKHTTFYIQFASVDDCLSVASVVWSDTASLSTSARTRALRARDTRLAEFTKRSMMIRQPRRRRCLDVLRTHPHRGGVPWDLEPFTRVGDIGAIHLQNGNVLIGVVTDV